MFRAPQPLSRQTLGCFCSGGPLGPRISPIPATLPARTRTIIQRERFLLPPVTSHPSPATKSFTIRTSEKHVRKPSGMNTSKTQHLKPFRMNTSEKTGGGEGAKLSISYSTKNFRGEHLAWASTPLVQSGELDSPHSEASLSDRRLLPCGLSTPGIVTPLPYRARKFTAITCVDKRLRAADSLCRTRTAFPVAAVELAGELAVNFLRRNHVHHAA